MNKCNKCGSIYPSKTQDCPRCSEALKPMPDSEVPLRFDGIYFHTLEDEDYLYYLRFYPDGTVVSLSSYYDPSDAYYFLNRKGQYTSIGTFKIEDEIISFNTTSSAGVVCYKGIFDGPETMALKTHSLINGHKDRCVFLFYRPEE